MNTQNQQPISIQKPLNSLPTSDSLQSSLETSSNSTLSNLSSVTTPGRSGILNSSTGNNLTSVPQGTLTGTNSLLSGSSMYGNSMYGNSMMGSSMYGGGMGYGGGMYGGGMYGGGMGYGSNMGFNGNAVPGQQGFREEYQGILMGFQSLMNIMGAGVGLIGYGGTFFHYTKRALSFIASSFTNFAYRLLGIGYIKRILRWLFSSQVQKDLLKSMHSVANVQKAGFGKKSQSSFMLVIYILTGLVLLGGYFLYHSLGKKLKDIEKQKQNMQLFDQTVGPLILDGEQQIPQQKYQQNNDSIFINMNNEKAEILEEEEEIKKSEENQNLEEIIEQDNEDFLLESVEGEEKRAEIELTQAPKLESDLEKEMAEDAIREESEQNLEASNEQDQNNKSDEDESKNKEIGEQQLKLEEDNKEPQHDFNMEELFSSIMNIAQEDMKKIEMQVATVKESEIENQEEKEKQDVEIAVEEDSSEKELPSQKEEPSQIENEQVDKILTEEIAALQNIDTEQQVINEKQENINAKTEEIQESIIKVVDEEQVEITSNEEKINETETQIEVKLDMQDVESKESEKSSEEKEENLESNPIKTEESSETMSSNKESNIMITSQMTSEEFWKPDHSVNKKIQSQVITPIMNTPIVPLSQIEEKPTLLNLQICQGDQPNKNVGSVSETTSNFPPFVPLPQSFPDTDFKLNNCLTSSQSTFSDSVTQASNYTIAPTGGDMEQTKVFKAISNRSKPWLK